MIKTISAMFAFYMHLSLSQNPQPFIPAVTSVPQRIITDPPILLTDPPIYPIVTTPPVVVPPVVVTQPAKTLGAYGQECKNPAVDTVCQNTQAIAASMNGNTKCEKDYDCCLCNSVQCGNFIQGCSMFSAGDHGVIGVKEINIQGKPSGAYINCIGVEGCMAAEMVATNIKDIDASGLNAMKNAKITVTDPLPQFALNCIGRNGCDGAQIEVIIPGPPMGYACNPNAKEIVRFSKLSCVDFESCKNMDLTIRNNGCNTIEINMLECLENDSCLGTNFNLIGDVQFNNCNLRGAATASTTGIENCFENLERLICPDPTSCRNAVRTLVNPINGFSLSCDHVGSCQNARFTIDINSDSLLHEPVKYFDTLKFSAEAAGAGATIIVNNKQGIILNIQRIECSVQNACAGTTFIIGHDVSVGEIICNPGTCGGCQIKINEASPGIPCDPNEVATFMEPGNSVPPIQTQGPQTQNTHGNAVGGKFVPI
eukprot:306289_1